MKVHVKSSAFGMVLLAVTLVAGCAAPGGGQMPQDEPSASPSAAATPGGSATPGVSASGRPPLSDVPPPTLGPPNPTQSRPSDYIAGDTIAGRVTKGGTGPCYEVTNEDDKVYVLHSTAGLALVEGTYVTAKVAPLRVKVDCGPGKALSLLSFTKQ
jgi:hypothetical protein